MIEIIRNISGTILPEYLMWLEPLIAYAFSITLLLVVLNTITSIFKRN